MSIDPNLDLIVKNFVANFNQMCRAANRDFLIRAQASKGETNKNPKTYVVEYKMRHTSTGWEIYAEWRKWIFFSKEFPFVQIYRLSGDRGYRMTGLFTENVPILKLNPAQFQQTLHDFLIHCRNLPGQSFVNV